MSRFKYRSVKDLTETQQEQREESLMLVLKRAVGRWEEIRSGNSSRRRCDARKWKILMRENSKGTVSSICPEKE
jgi:hypothetical protein